MDNFKTHTASAFYETFEPKEAKRLCDRFEFVFTPKHGSWLNMAEIELHVLTGQCLNPLVECLHVKDIQAGIPIAKRIGINEFNTPMLASN